MFKSIGYVLKENFNNLYRIYCIAKYELLSEMRDSKLGLFWNFASPMISVLTYWLIFGIAWHRKPVGNIPYLPWIIVGFAAWRFIQTGTVSGCSAIFAKTHVITKMKFPVSVLPATVCVREFFNHLCMMLIAVVTVLICGFRPNVYWLGILYYMVCAFVYVEGLALILSVLTMLFRDIKKLVVSLMRLFMYLSPVIWNCHFDETVPGYEILNIFMELNPAYYIVNGYRDSVFYGRAFWELPTETAVFWLTMAVLFTVGCSLMYKFKTKFIDLI